MKTVFISYSQNDLNIAETIFSYLESKGTKCWLAPRNITAGKYWAGEIIRAIRECDVMILVYSKNSASSKHVVNEVAKAFDSDKIIIPFIIDSTPMRDDLDYYLLRTHWLVAYPEYKDKLEILYNSIVELASETNCQEMSDNQLYKEMASFCKDISAEGNPDAQNNLGICYAEGKGVERNENEAFKLFGLAAAQGHIEAIDNIGRCYYNGIGTKQNFSEAYNWFRKAAELGNPQAQYTLGVCYNKGNGVAQDYTEAIKWFKKAAEQDHTDALASLAQCYKNGIGVKKDSVEANKYMVRAANNGSDWAQNQLGIMLFVGDGVERDKTKAIQWFKKAAEHGNKDAQKNLERCLNL